MKPIFIARKSVLPLSLRVERRWPAIHTSPDVKSSIPERQFRRVVLPHPDGPITATISPFRTSRSRPRSAWTAPPPLSYVFTRRRATTIRSSTRAALAGGAAGAGTVMDSGEGGAFEREAERMGRREEGEECARHPEADQREAEHEAAEVRPRALRRSQDDPHVLALVERPVHREDPQDERQQLRDRHDADGIRAAAPDAR